MLVVCVSCDSGIISSVAFSNLSSKYWPTFGKVPSQRITFPWFSLCVSEKFSAKILYVYCQSSLFTDSMFANFATCQNLSVTSLTLECFCSLCWVCAEQWKIWVTKVHVPSGGVTTQLWFFPSAVMLKSGVAILWSIWCHAFHIFVLFIDDCAV